MYEIEHFQKYKLLFEYSLEMLKLEREALERVYALSKKIDDLNRYLPNYVVDDNYIKGDIEVYKKQISSLEERIVRFSERLDSGPGSYSLERIERIISDVKDQIYRVKYRKDRAWDVLWRAEKREIFIREERDRQDLQHEYDTTSDELMFLNNHLKRLVAEKENIQRNSGS